MPSSTATVDEKRRWMGAETHLHREALANGEVHLQLRRAGRTPVLAHEIVHVDRRRTRRTAPFKVSGKLGGWLAEPGLRGGHRRGHRVARARRHEPAPAGARAARERARPTAGARSGACSPSSFLGESSSGARTPRARAPSCAGCSGSRVELGGRSPAPIDAGDARCAAGLDLGALESRMARLHRGRCELPRGRAGARPELRFHRPSHLRNRTCPHLVAQLPAATLAGRPPRSGDDAAKRSRPAKRSWPSSRPTSSRCVTEVARARARWVVSMRPKRALARLVGGRAPSRS